MKSQKAAFCTANMACLSGYDPGFSSIRLTSLASHAGHLLNCMHLISFTTRKEGERRTSYIRGKMLGLIPQCQQGEIPRRYWGRSQWVGPWAGRFREKKHPLSSFWWLIMNRMSFQGGLKSLQDFQHLKSVIGGILLMIDSISMSFLPSYTSHALEDATNLISVAVPKMHWNLNEPRELMVSVVNLRPTRSIPCIDNNVCMNHTPAGYPQLFVVR